MSEGRPTKAERREQARVERERIQQRARRRAAYRKVWIAAGVLGAVAVVGLVVLVPRADETASGAPPQGVRDFEVASRNHVEGTVSYPQDPPVGGTTPRSG